MKIINLTDAQFDDYSRQHSLHTYFQTSSYAKVMHRQGYQIKFLGFLEDNKLLGAALVLCDMFFAKYKYAYVPRGFLTDYTNRDLIQKISISLKKALSKEGIAFIKIDPPIIDYKRDATGKVIAKANILSSQVLLSCGFIPTCKNLFFESLKPRWNAHINAINDANLVLDSFDKQIKNKVRKAKKRELDIIQLKPQEVERFYKFVAKKHYRKVNYYADMQNFFNASFEMYVARLDTNKYLKIAQNLFEKEQEVNFEIGQELQSASTKGIEMRSLISKKIESDKVMNSYNRELKNATVLLAKYPDGLDIAAIAIVKTAKTINFLIDGFDPRFKNIYPSFLLKWYIIDKYAKQNYNHFDLNAITGDFTEKNKYKGLNEMKLGFNSEIAEYIGEFDYVFNPSAYKIYSKMGGDIVIKKKMK